MYAWEPYFWKKIRGIRLKEMAILRKIARVTACSIVCATHSPFMVNNLDQLYTYKRTEVIKVTKFHTKLEVLYMCNGVASPP